MASGYGDLDGANTDGVNARSSDAKYRVGRDWAKRLEIRPLRRDISVRPVGKKEGRIGQGLDRAREADSLMGVAGTWLRSTNLVC